MREKNGNFPFPCERKKRKISFPCGRKNENFPVSLAGKKTQKSVFFLREEKSTPYRGSIFLSLRSTGGSSRAKATHDDFFPLTVDKRFFEVSEMPKKGNSPERLGIIRKMPPLHHTIPGQPFRMEDSEVIYWLIRQPSILAYMFDKAKKYMRYDNATGTWQGVDYAD